MGEEYYNLPMVRENFVSRNLKKLFQGFFNIKRKKRDQKRAQKTIKNHSIHSINC